MLLGCISSTAQSTDQLLNGEWQLTSIELKIPSSERLMLTVSGSQVSGTLYRDGKKIAVGGTVDGQNIRLVFKDGDEEDVYVGTLSNGTMSGTYTATGKDQKSSGEWNARRAAADKPAQLRTLDFRPTEFHRALSANVPPVMRIWPGDTVRTSSVDAGGQDEKSVQRVAGGNPLTGPFYIEGAMPGDVLAVTIKRLQINRDWAESDSGLVGRALTIDYVSANKQKWDTTRWHLDAEKQVATLENAPASLKGFPVPLHPMLGCVGVAPGPYSAPLSTQDSGDLGGNMDFNGISEGSTLYLQVNQPGALLYVGDAHARQGDGELNGNALETSMDIEFTVAVEREKSIDSPRVENADFIMTMGLSGSLDNAFRIATSEMAKWLQTDYKLSASEAAIMLGTSIEYNISEVADRNVGVVAKIRKSTLSALTPAK